MFGTIVILVAGSKTKRPAGGRAVFLAQFDVF